MTSRAIAVGSDVSVLDSDSLKKLVFLATGAPDYQPPLLPESITRLMKLAGDPNADFAEIERVVSADPTVAAKVVATANSAFFSRGVRIDSIRTAITRLGLVQIRDLAFHAAVTARIFKVPEYQETMADEQRHALGAGLICREVCRMLGMDPEMAFLCGLLHDIGKSLSLGIVVDRCRSAKHRLPSAMELEGPIHDIHPAVGARICALWNLPLLICESVDRHHQPFVQGQLHQMAAVVAVADLCCQHAGIGRRERPVDVMLEKIFFDLNLHPKQAEGLLQRAIEIAAQL